MGLQPTPIGVVSALPIILIIGSAEELKGLANRVNTGTTYSGKYWMGADINLENYACAYRRRLCPRCDDRSANRGPL